MKFYLHLSRYVHKPLFILLPEHLEMVTRSSSCLYSLLIHVYTVRIWIRYIKNLPATDERDIVARKD